MFEASGIEGWQIVMNELGCSPLIRRTLPICNCSEQALTLRLEPWSDEFEILPNEELVIVFIGPPDGEPSLNSGTGWIEVYGWPGCEGFVFRDGQRLGPSATILEIIQQEFQLDRGLVRSTRKLNEMPLTDLVRHAQAKLELLFDARAHGDGRNPEVGSLHAALISLGIFEELRPSESAANFVWRICSRILQTYGFTLPDVKASLLVSLLKTGDSDRLAKILVRSAFQIRPVAEASLLRTRKQPPAKSRSTTRRPKGK